jgi:dTDP-4-amino-4,6-dideoxygalactose transaminase
LLINDPKYIERAENIREKGTNRSHFFRGLVDKYTWVEIGSSYVMSDLLAGMLFGQLEAREEIQNRRKAVWDRYQAAFQPWKGAKPDDHANGTGGLRTGLSSLLPPA